MAYATVEQLAEALRLKAVTADNTQLLTDCLEAAASEIDADLDRIDPLPVAVQGTVPVLWSSLWRFANQTTMADPGQHNVRRNADPPTQLAISTIDDDGVDRYAQLTALVVDGRVAIRSTTTVGSWGLFALVAVPVDLTTWVRLDVAQISIGSGSQTPGNNERLLFDFSDPPMTPAEAGYPPAIVRTNVNRAVEWFKAADANNGQIGTDQTGVLAIPFDGFQRYAVTIRPWKQQWGIG